MILLAALLPAAAFSPGMHRSITARAAELEGLPEPAAIAARASAWEDWDVLRKWVRYNHYYSPRFSIPTRWRAPSDVRVAALAGAIARDPDGLWRRVGQAVHHVQDMASPPHVIPVAHGLLDDFESFDMTGLVGRVRGRDVGVMDPVLAHHRLAVETRDALDGTLGCGAALSDFWVERGGRFGEHGPSAFGRVPGCEDDARAFVEDRLDAAIGYTRAVLRWAAATDSPATARQASDGHPSGG